ncbi:MAG: DMT family transporter [Chloroflexi bacterium]|nr:MAG: DMT family transporter [Chloroflexota bacterium]MBL1192924.1 DMT family transporter [Chloroflexota bacterium]NOH10217.1 DMT family transporter [Chloroflexota bacterium]
METKKNPQLIAILQALLVTVLWSTSWVLIVIGLEDIPALTFAGLRYTLAFVALLPFFLRNKRATPLRELNRSDWLWLLALGLVYYTITQGTQFVTLQFLPTITFSLLLNFSAVFVALLGIPFLNERPTALQWLGIGVFIAGVLVYFYPVIIPAGLFFGFLMATIHILSNSAASILGRFVNRGGKLHPLTVTVVSMGIGSLVLLGTGIVVEGVPVLDWRGWAIVIWLAIVNTAFAFTLWNHTLRTLSATQSSMINNTMLVQIAILAWIFLGERITGMEAVGLAIALVGSLMVTLRRETGSP